MKTLVVDFDGVIHNYQGWRDGSIYGEPIPGVREALTELKKKYQIIVYSTRCHDRWINGHKQLSQIYMMYDWLKIHNISRPLIWFEPGKPKGDLYIDDHGYRFENWTQALKDIPELC